MTFGRSMLSVLGAWVAWVYLLSLLVLLGVPTPKSVGTPRPNVRFVEAETTFQCPAGADRNALADIEVEVSEPLDHDIAIPVKTIRGSARPAEHYDADADAAVVIKAGETRGRLRRRDELLDVTVRPEGVGREPLRFTLELQHTLDVVAAPDPLGRREVEIPAATADSSDGLSPRLITAGFEEPFMTVAERDFAGLPFQVRADRPVDADADVHFELRRGIGDSATVVHKFRRIMRQGAADMSFRLADVIPDDALRALGLADDDVPGPDEYYELHADPRPPLIAAGDPCFQAVIVEDDDGAVDLTQILEDRNGSRIRRITPGEPFWVVPELSRPLERDCSVVPMINGRPRPPGGVIAAGQTRGPRFGPFVEKGDKETIPVSVEGDVPSNGLRRCKSCNGHDRDCPHCKAKGPCRTCKGRAGGCEACKGGQGPCRGCSGRPGGCLACGFGKGVCGHCNGEGGQCSACGKGAGGGGAGAGGPVNPATPRNVPAGPPVQGDFLLLLVNNQRLHEPGDTIAANVVEAIKDENAYRDAAFVVNETDETELKKGTPPPSPETTFRPFSRENEDLSGQVQRIVDTIAEKRNLAAKDRLPTVVIWPERELSSAADLGALAQLAADGGGPISILCPDADPEKARRLAAALQPPGGAKDKVTVRSPKTPELVEHIRDVIHAGREQKAAVSPPREPGR